MSHSDSPKELYGSPNPEGTTESHDMCVKNYDAADEIADNYLKPSDPVVAAFYKKHHKRNWFAWWFMGMINDFHFCLIQSSSVSLAVLYHMKNLSALISHSFFGVWIVRIINTFCLSWMSYKLRMFLTAFQILCGIFLICLAISLHKKNNRINPNRTDVVLFLINYLGSISLGDGCSYGEAVMLGYLERFPSNYMSPWSCGTGFSGPVATLFLLACEALGVNHVLMYAVSAIFVILYMITFFWILVVPVQENVSEDAISASRGTTPDKLEEEQGEGEFVITPSNIWKSLPWLYDPHLHQERKVVVNDEIEQNRGNCWTRFKRWWRSPVVREWVFIHNSCFANYTSLALVYMFEYCSSFMAPYAFCCYGHDPKASKFSNFVLKHSFPITQLCYTIACLISRSSTICVRIQLVWLTTILQFINAVLWVTQAKYKYIGPRGAGTKKINDAGELMPYFIILFILMFYVGLLGGANYANVFYNILDYTKTEEFNEGADKARATGVLAEGEVDEQLTEDREIVIGKRSQSAMNMGLLYQSLGVTVGLSFPIFFETFVLTHADGCIK